MGGTRKLSSGKQPLTNPSGLPLSLAMSSSSAGPDVAGSYTCWTQLLRLLSRAYTYAYAAFSNILPRFARKHVSPADFRAAAGEGREAILRAYLRSSSASHKRLLLLDERSGSGLTPLMLAAYHGHAASVALLLRHLPAMQVSALTTDKKNTTTEELSISSTICKHTRCLSMSLNFFNYSMLAVFVGPNAAHGMRQQLGMQGPQPNPKSEPPSSDRRGAAGKAAAAPAPSSADDRGNSALMFAASAGAAACMRLLLQHSPGVQVAAAGVEGHTTLMMAALGGYDDCVQLLLQHRPNEQVVAVSQAGLNALMMALIASSPPEVLRALGIEVFNPKAPPAPEGKRDSGSGTQAPVAIPGGDHDACVKLLLQHCPGQQVELKAGSRCTPTALMLASMTGRSQLVLLLLQHSPDTQVVAVDRCNRTALMMAAEAGHEECVRLLLEHSPHAQVAAADSRMRTALMMAAAAGHEDCLRRLLQHCPDSQVAAADRSGQTALMLAAEHGSGACVARLLRHSPLAQVVSRTCWYENPFESKKRAGTAPQHEHELGPGAGSSTGNSALMFAAFGGHEECVLLLLRHMPETQLTTPNSSGFTALMVAAWAGRETCVPALLQHCPEPQLTAASEHGRTALMLAACRGHEPCIRALLQHIPVQQVEQRNAEGSYGSPAGIPHGESALILAALEGHETCLKLLLQHSPRAQVAATSRAPVYYRMGCLDTGKGVEGVTALMAAAHGGHSGCVALLLQHSTAAQVAACNAEKKCARTLAALAKHFDCMQLLERASRTPAGSQGAARPPPSSAARAEGKQELPQERTEEQQKQLNNDLVQCLLDWSKLSDATAPLPAAASPIRAHMEQLLADGAVLPEERELPPGSGSRDALERILWIMFRDTIARARAPDPLNAAVVALAVKTARR